MATVHGRSVLVVRAFLMTRDDSNWIVLMSRSPAMPGDKLPVTSKPCSSKTVFKNNGIPLSISNPGSQISFYTTLSAKSRERQFRNQLVVPKEMEKGRKYGPSLLEVVSQLIFIQGKLN